jgi:hypothetical protein
MALFINMLCMAFFYCLAGCRYVECRGAEATIKLHGSVGRERQDANTAPLKGIICLYIEVYPRQGTLT